MKGQTEGSCLHERHVEDDIVGVPLMSPDFGRRVLNERGVEHTMDIRRRNIKRCVTKWCRVVVKTWFLMADADYVKTFEEKT